MATKKQKEEGRQVITVSIPIDVYSKVVECAKAEDRTLTNALIHLVKLGLRNK